ncbi:MAG: ATP-binding cassette domain-containing protein [SAR324 cluster bacterium]|nr:ATP-binding cassette domain-containing protein [SAR324 cluster bacterium]
MPFENPAPENGGRDGGRDGAGENEAGTPRARNGARAAHPPGGDILPLRLEGVCYAPEGRTLVGELTLELRDGGPTVVLGANGAGKSLTLRLCHGLLEPTAGTVRWMGPDAARARWAQAMVFQRPVLLRRSVLANVVYGLALRGVSRRERPALAMEALRATGLEAMAGRQARVLSAGEAQRLSLARAWALRPRVLFLDEPTANLDPAASRAVEEIIAAIGAAGTKIVMTTHDLGQARRLAHEVLFMHRGRVLERSPAPQFFQQPNNEAARAFLKGELLW